jgi:hypothetical protein
MSRHGAGAVTEGRIHAARGCGIDGSGSPAARGPGARPPEAKEPLDGLAFGTTRAARPRLLTSSRRKQGY